jgi:signal peptidase I
LKENSSVEGYQQIASKLARSAKTNVDQIKLQVISGSMAPLLEAGDTVIVIPASTAMLQRGDIIVVFKNEEFITHRLVERRGECLFTKGDRFHHFDAPVTSEALIGKVVGIYKGDEYLDFSKPRWIIMNRLEGMLNWWEGEIFKLWRKLKMKIYKN